MNAIDKLYKETRIFDDYPYIGPSQSIVTYFDDCLDNLLSLDIYLADFKNTKQDRLKIKKCMNNLLRIKRTVLSIYEYENPNDEVEEEDDE